MAAKKNGVNERVHFGFENEMLRAPGQSVQERLDNFMDDSVDPQIAIVVFSAVLLIYVWVHHFFQIFDTPWLISVILGLVIVYGTYKLYKYRRIIQKYKQGIRGEQYVAQILNELQHEKCTVFHDLKAVNFNIDHVVVSDNGVYIIETKTFTKYTKKGSLRIEQGGFVINGFTLPHSPLDQASSLARWYSNFLQQCTGKHFSVVPIVAMPSWYIEHEQQAQAKSKGVALLNPKQIKVFVNQGTAALSTDDLNIITHCTKQHIIMSKQNDV